ncbi:MAG: histidine kinase, partial [Oscillospiraceae bacterium]|nr:histidine kinase [Oscillospiraceae bacterium]
ALSGLADMVLYYSPAPSVTLKPALALESLLLLLPLPMLTVYLLHCCGENIRASMLLRVVLGLWAVCLVLLISLLFTDAVFYILPDRNYSRGPLFPLVLLPIIATALLNLAGAIQRRDRLSRKAFLSFLIALLPMTGALLVHLFVDVTPLIDICNVLSAHSMYSLILSDQMEQDLRRQREITEQQREIANQRASIMVLQMRPHFIYNTLTSIYCLCSQDPKLAQRIVMDFTTYLRKNFTAVASARPIPFSSELEHTRAYLSVEQARFPSSLRVEYDTPHTWFRVPPLTLQPIVENAVKHGRDPCAGLFTISIRTRKTDSGTEIVVADNGRGFSPGDDSDEHIALKNIRQRLALMCGGSLTITANDGGGTVVTITIPDSAAER